MKKHILTLILGLFTFMGIGQTILYNDNCETIGYNWYGYPTNPQFPSVYSTYFGGTTTIDDRPQNKPLYVSNSTSFGLYGLGDNTSGSEFERYQLPNITGLSLSKVYRFSFKLMAYAENFSGFNGSGLDVSDSVTVRVSVNNGPYVIESIIKGWSNSYWSFDATGVINESANGLPNIYRPITGGNQETTGFGFSTYNLTITNITQIRVRIDMRSNYGGLNYGEWWVIDDMKLIEESALPIELLSFEGSKKEEYNVLKWQTASEHNNSHFILERSVTGDYTEKDVINVVNGAGNSTQLLDYDFVDTDAPESINYYRLTQVDYDGNFKQYGPISIDNRVTRNIVKYFNIMGQEVNEYDRGLIILQYEDGTVEKVIR